MSTKTWGYSGQVGEWSVDIAIPAELQDRPQAAVQHVLALLAGPVQALHRPRQVEISWAELDEAGEELDFHELEEHATPDWAAVIRVVTALAPAPGARVAVSALFVQLDTTLVDAGEDPAESSAQLQISIASPEATPTLATVSYTTSIDVWVPMTLGPDRVLRDNREVAERNLPRLAALLDALGTLGGSDVRVGTSQHYASVLDVRGFRPTSSARAR